MPKKWLFGSSYVSYVVTRREDLFPPDAAVADPSVFKQNFDQWASNPEQYDALIDLWRSIGGGAGGGASGLDVMRRELFEAFSGGVLVILRTRPREVLPRLAETPAPAPPQEQKREEKKTTWIKFKVVDDATSAPVLGVELDIKLPSGEQTVRTTKSNGIIDILDIEPGSCSVTSDIKYARLADTLNFMAMGESPTTKKKKGGSNEPPEYTQSGGVWHVAEIKAHKVKKNETLTSIAEAAGLGWRELTFFNWGTSDPDEINEHLRDSVGCTKRTRDGRSYMFDDTDEPGVVYVPRKWKKDGLATEQTHTVRVKLLDRFLIILENEQKLRIPEAQFEAELADKSKVQARTGRSGIYAIEDPPPGKVVIEWKDYDDIKAKSLAACARKAFDEHDTEEILHIIEHSPQLMKLVVKAYEKYYNDYTGKGLVEDIYHEFTDPEALPLVEVLLTQADLPARSKIELVPVER